MGTQPIMYQVTCGKCHFQRAVPPEDYARGERGVCPVCHPTSLVVCPVCRSSRSVAIADAKAGRFGACAECATRRRLGVG